jgi:ketosteroid isomerase-like protein
MSRNGKERLMTSLENKQAIVNAYASMAAGNSGPYLDLLSDDISITMFGDHRFARTFKGRDDIYNNLFGPIREVLDGAIRMNVTNATAENDLVVIEALGQARTKDGRSYENSYCFVFRFEDGKIIESREYMDTQLVKATFG